jgi:acetyltransferase-like isoleucine patch superfamily enzyme
MLNLLQILFDKFLKKDLIIGKHTYGKPRIIRYGTSEIAYIGKFCSIANNVTLILTGNHRTEWITTYPFPSFYYRWKQVKKIKDHIVSKGDIVIGNDVWIGYGALILPGVTIHDGAVIGAKAVVTKDVEPYTIVAGNPAHVIKKRFSDKEISRLLKLQWWNWPDEKIRKSIPLLCSEIDSLKLLESYEKEK